MYLEAYQKSSGELGTGHNASELFWAEYLTEIQKNSLTGEWAKEVIKHSIEDGNGIVK